MAVKYNAFFVNFPYGSEQETLDDFVKSCKLDKSPKTITEATIEGLESFGVIKVMISVEIVREASQ